ncbi:MAG: T9SS type A sorting domain-containing protein [candidate division WOR-3 bacterium]
MHRFVIVFIPLIVSSNPYLTGVINEFQTDTILGQKFEFHPIDYGFSLPLFNSEVITPAGTSYVNTLINNPPCGYTVIDTSILEGPFYLPLDNGFIEIFLPEYYLDCIAYTDTFHSPIFAPPMGSSAARFIYKKNGLTKLDWYIDYTPTLGGDNDDYPGCIISGHVYFNYAPVESARVTAVCTDSIQTPGPFHTACTTYTDNTGFYHFDSLWPARYWMTAVLGSYQPPGELSPELCALWPTDFDFYFVEMEENLSFVSPEQMLFSVYPNPFKNFCVIRYALSKSMSGTYSATPTIRIYDVTGRLVRQFDCLSTSQFSQNQILWNGKDRTDTKLTPGLYYIVLESPEYKSVKKAVMIR